MTTNEKISALRAAAKAAGGSGVLLMTSDPHCSEYLPDHYGSVAYFSGFTGENATLVVTEMGSALWCDGRFYVQGDKQLAGTEIVCMHDKAAGVPSVEEYLKQHIPGGGTLFLDGACVPAATAKRYREALASVNAALQSRDLVKDLWTAGRPALPATPCRLLDAAVTGFTAAEKLAQVREKLAEKGADALAVTGLDCVGWLLNLRASDLPCTPLALAFALVEKNACTLFVAPGRLSAADAQTLADNGVAVRGYGELNAAVAALPADAVVLLDEEHTNFDLYNALCARKTVPGEDPILALKGVKNPVELENIRECHIRDGVAVVRFEMDLEKALAAGKTLHETDIEKMLQARRGEQPGYFDDSFGTIAAYGPNAAMMHYHAEGEVDSVIERRGFLLVDNGGQYDCGTTDITRTYPVGPLTNDERLFYTLVLKSHIDLAKAVFLDSAPGCAVDTFARAALWQHKIDYRCGTGHGVGFIASVHEGPQRLNGISQVKFVPGMTITDEPGVYETDLVGIRIENELECVDLGDNQYGHWLGFAPLTMVPIATAPLLTDELDREELNWLNAYHKQVYDTLAPRLSAEEQAWLAEKTKPVER